MQQTAQTSTYQLSPPDYQHAWQMVVGQIESDLSRADFETWIKPIRPLSLEERVYTLGVNNATAQNWLESRVKSRVTLLLGGLLGYPVVVRFTLLPPPALPAEEPPASETGTAGRSASRAASPRKLVLERAYGSERARLIQPERGMFLTLYFFNNWLPLLGHSAATVILAARSMCYWNPVNGELRNTVDTEMSELARRAAVSVRTVKDVLSQKLVREYFLRYTVRRMMTPNGVRTAGITLQVRMDDPVTPEDQAAYNLSEPARWYTADFEDESED